MDKLFVVIKREFMERIRNRWFIAITLLMPAFMAASIILPTWLLLRTGASQDLSRIIVLDATTSGLGASVLANIKLDSVAARKQDSIAPYKPDIRVIAPAQLAAAEEKATAEVQRPHSYAGYLVLKDSTLATGAARYAGRNASSMTDVARIESAVRQSVMVVRLGKEGVKSDIIKEISRFRADISTERISDKGKGGSGGAAFGVGFFLAFLLYISIMLHGQAAMRGVLEEKTTRVAEIVISSVKPDVLLAGKVIGIGAVGLLQQVAWFGLSAAAVFYLMPFLVHGMAVPRNDGVRLAADTVKAVASAAPAAAPVTMAALNLFTWQLALTVLGFFLTGFIFYVSLYAAAGSMVNSEQEAQQAAMPVIMLLVFTIIFLNPVMANANGTLAVTLSWLPFSSPIIMPTRMALGAVTTSQVIGAWIVSAIGSIAAVWLAARIYRVGMLMYGKKPSFRELAKWIGNAA